MTAIPEALRDTTYVSVETFRKDGTGVKTPVWCACVDDALYVSTPATSWKARRLARDPRARIAACDGRGREILSDWVDATGAAVEPGAERDRAQVALKAKYGIQYRLFALAARLRGRAGDQAVLRFDLT